MIEFDKIPIDDNGRQIIMQKYMMDGEYSMAKFKIDDFRVTIYRNNMLFYNGHHNTLTQNARATYAEHWIQITRAKGIGRVCSKVSLNHKNSSLPFLFPPDVVFQDTDMEAYEAHMKTYNKWLMACVKGLMAFLEDV